MKRMVGTKDPLNVASSRPRVGAGLHGSPTDYLERECRGSYGGCRYGGSVSGGFALGTARQYRPRGPGLK